MVTYDPLLGELIPEMFVGEADIPPFVVVHTLKAAQDELKSQVFAVMITDWTRIPGPKAIAAAQEAGVPGILVMNGGLATPEEIVRLGVESIPKPCSIEELIAAVRRLLEKQKKLSA